MISRWLDIPLDHERIVSRKLDTLFQAVGMISNEKRVIDEEIFQVKTSVLELLGYFCQ